MLKHQGAFICCVPPRSFPKIQDADISLALALSVYVLRPMIHLQLIYISWKKHTYNYVIFTSCLIHLYKRATLLGYVLIQCIHSSFLNLYVKSVCWPALHAACCKVKDWLSYQRHAFFSVLARIDPGALPTKQTTEEMNLHIDLGCVNLYVWMQG